MKTLVNVLIIKSNQNLFIFCVFPAACNPCKNQNCTTTSISQGYCLCDTESSGEYMACPVLNGMCDLNPVLCLNGGRCRNDNRTRYGFSCDCPNEYISGLRCETVTEPDPCFFVNCSNGGVCISKQCPNNGTCSIANRYTCECKVGFNGRFCENENICENKNPCKNNATCIQNNNTITCACLNGFSGIFCENRGFKKEIILLILVLKWVVLIDPCYSVSCLNGGTCVNIPCPNNGTCSIANRYTCECKVGFNGIFFKYFS